MLSVLFLELCYVREEEPKRITSARLRSAPVRSASSRSSKWRSGSPDARSCTASSKRVPRRQCYRQRSQESVRAHATIISLRIIPKEWHEARRRERVLVGASSNGNALSLLGVTEPAPPRTLDTGRLGRHLLLERLEAAELGVDGLAESAVGLTAAAVVHGREVGPEDGVVDVAAAVEAERRLQSDHLGVVFLVLRLGELLKSYVVVGHVCLVVLLVVELHDLARDYGLQCTKVVRQVRQRDRRDAALDHRLRHGSRGKSLVHDHCHLDLFLDDSILPLKGPSGRKL